MSDPTLPTLKKRRIWIAVILSLLCPGLGHLYNTQYRRAVVLIGITVLANILWWLFLVAVPPVNLTILAVAVLMSVGTLLFYVGVAVNAAIGAKRAGAVVLGRLNRWYVYVGVAVAMSLFTPGGETFPKPLGKWRGYNIPSASMAPTLLFGDYFLSHEGYYANNEPARGEIAIFKFPPDTKIDYVKRVVGLPGDRIQMRGGILHVNGEPVKREPIEDFVAQDGVRPFAQYIETLPGGTRHRVTEVSDSMQLDNTSEFLVPVSHYFVLGDNRDNSLDSRVDVSRGGVGFVPRENFRDRPMMIFWSKDFSRIGLRVQPAE